MVQASLLQRSNFATTGYANHALFRIENEFRRNDEYWVIGLYFLAFRDINLSRILSSSLCESKFGSSPLSRKLIRIQGLALPTILTLWQAISYN